MNNVPQIRFPGFTDPWEQRKVKDVCSISTGKSNTQDKVDDGEYPFYVRSPIIEHSNKFLFDEEAVLTVGDGVGTGKVFHYVNGKYDLHQRVYRLFGFSEDTDAKFFYHWFSSHFYDRVMSMTAKTSVDSVRLEMISDMNFIAPGVDEQRRIASCLGYLDNIITLHQRKCEELKIYKKGLLQHMFPQPGEAFPRLRFPEFTDPWEQRKLGTVVDVCSGKDYKHLAEGNIPVYGTGGYMLSVSEALSQQDAIGIGRKGTIDNPYILKAPFWTVDTLFYCIPKSCDLDFVYALYQTINWRSMDESTGVPSLSKTAINDVEIHVPSVDEQHCIGELFSNLDATITLHQRKCDELNEYKKGLLQKMFV